MSDATPVEEPAAPLSIEERLLYLEEQNEGLKRVGKLLLGLCLLLGILLVYTQSNLREAVYSEALILSGGNNARATLTTTPSNHLGLLFYDHQGILPPDPKFNAIPYLDGIVLYDRAGNPRIVMGVNDKDQAVLDVVGPQGQVQFSATRTGAADPQAQGTPGAPAPTGNAGQPGTAAPAAAGATPAAVPAAPAAPGTAPAASATPNPAP